MQRLKIKLPVIRGAGRGKKIGIPTLNFQVPPSFSLEQGIYAGWLHVEEKTFPIAIHFGPRPTFGESAVTLEAHVIGPYGLSTSLSQATIEFVARIRQVENFTNPQEMVKQIAKDIVMIQDILKQGKNDYLPSSTRRGPPAGGG